VTRYIDRLSIDRLSLLPIDELPNVICIHKTEEKYEVLFTRAIQNENLAKTGLK